MMRKPYVSDVTNKEWMFVAPYLILMKEDSLQREHDRKKCKGFTMDYADWSSIAADATDLPL